MPAIPDFDKFFLHLPPHHREKNFNDFWNSAIDRLKKIPIEPSFEPVRGAEAAGMPSGFTMHTVTFRGSNKSPVRGDLFIPKNEKKRRVVMLVHDYNRMNQFPSEQLKPDFAYFRLQLRGHDILLQNMETARTAGKDPAAQPGLPGYMAESILDTDAYYVKSVYLDVYRAIDCLRLNKALDCSSIGIIGKGLGAAAAVFAAAFSDRVGALVLDSPSFCYLPLSQNLSNGDATTEINSFINAHKGKRDLIKKNLTYFDALHFVDRITCPVLAAVGFRDTIAPPQCAFALFNHLQTDKTVEVYPDDDNNAGGSEQMKKALSWLADMLIAR